MFKAVKIWDFVFGAIIFFLAFFLHISYGRLNSDNGIFLAGAQSLLNNLSIYKDFFSFTTPGTYYLLAIIWQILVPSYWLAWGAALLFLLIAAFFVYKITALISRPAAYLAVLSFVITTNSWPIITSHVFCLPFIFGAIYLFLLWQDKRQPKLIYGAGLLAGISVIFLQTIGLVTLAVLIISSLYLYLREKEGRGAKQLLWLCLFSCLPIVLLFFKWSPLFLFNNLIKFPLNNYSTTVTSSYWLLGLNFLFLLFFWFILGKKELGAKVKIINLLFVWQIGLFLTALSYPDFAHISFVFAPLLIMFSVLASKLFVLKNKSLFLAGITLSGIFTFYLIFHFLLNSYLLNFPYLSLRTSTPELITFIRENCQTKYIYAGPFLPEIYFETDKLTPGPSHWLLTNHHPDEYFLETREGLERYQPDCLVLNYEMVKKFNYNKNNYVDNYLNSNYQVVKSFGDTLILKR
jgi:hypothetical protein